MSLLEEREELAIKMDKISREVDGHEQDVRDYKALLVGSCGDLVAVIDELREIDDKIAVRSPSEEDTPCSENEKRS